MPGKFLVEIACLECGTVQAGVELMAASCSKCGSGWLDARYDYDRVMALWPGIISQRDRSLWRYSELLPLEPTFPEITMGEGFTPLLRLYQYEKLYHHQPIFVKDERHEPTSSFKDRQAALSVMAMRQAGIAECVLASTGNAAVAYAAYCARAGIKLWLFLTSLVPAEKMREAALYGAEVVKVSGTYDETKQVAHEFAHRKGIHLDRGAKAIPGKESMKTLGYEIAEQLGLALHPSEPDRWAAPDWYIQAVSGGIGPLGVWKGFTELYQMGLIDKLPKLGIIQAAGCAPMVRAFEAGLETAPAVVPKTLITVLATGDPGYSYVQLRQAILSYGGTMMAVEDGDTFRAMRHVASKAGISVEPATAVAFAGLEKMLTEKIIQPDEVVVINCSGHTFPAESHILGDQYDRYILDLQVDVSAERSSSLKEEGLGAALLNLNEQVTTIVIVDDNPNDRRLIRRLLQSYKNYRVYEARDGAEGLTVVRDRKPDLVVCDLTMPEMDGFTFLEQIKSDPEIAHIPVIVVSAKALTARDRKILSDHSESVWTKGGFDTRQLVDHVVHTLGHTPVDRPERFFDKSEPQQMPEQSAEDSVIVIIDDNRNDLRLAKRILQSGGRYHIIDAETGRDGLKAIYKYHPDMVILDMHLPDMIGFEIIETLQNDPDLKDIPVILYSAQEFVMEQFPGNIRGFIHKSSIDRQVFLHLINEELV